MAEVKFEECLKTNELIGSAGARLLSWYEHNYPQYEFTGVHDKSYRGTDSTRYVIAMKEKSWLGRTRLNEVARIKEAWNNEDNFINVEVSDPNFKDHSRTLHDIMMEVDDRMMFPLEEFMKEGGFNASTSFYLQQFGKFKPEHRHPLFEKRETDERHYPRVYTFQYEGCRYVAYSPGSCGSDIVLGRMEKKISIGGFIKDAILHLLGRKPEFSNYLVELGYLKGPGRKGIDWAYIDRTLVDRERIQAYLNEQKKKEAEA